MGMDQEQQGRGADGCKVYLCCYQIYGLSSRWKLVFGDQELPDSGTRTSQSWLYQCCPLQTSLSLIVIITLITN